jgi:hypothetical protein
MGMKEAMVSDDGVMYGVVWANAIFKYGKAAQKPASSSLNATSL